MGVVDADIPARMMFFLLQSNNATDTDVDIHPVERET
jgi:hypothetical protein